MKKRLDVLLCEQNPELTRSKAQTIIMSGVVFVNNQKELKCGTMFPEDVTVEIRGETQKYVSRGGLKLEKAMAEFPIDLNGKVCMDIGSSTGGFTDCMLQNGASKVYAVDVGKGQLDYKLRTDSRVVVMEKTNIRYVTPDMIDDVLDFASVDVSFISLTLVIPVALTLLNEKKEMVMLIKPQFEAGREKVGKKGVVRERSTHEEVIEKITDFVLDKGLSVAGLTFSPVKGPEGNIEYLIYVNSFADKAFDKGRIKEVVDAAHEELDK
ncbi:MAG: TlyA family RNA methyltransferase [Lachnospiraceae bacterium]|nr:TlyA family RNA methyltransferase [Lachnospiraceae bacterium]